MIAVGAKAKAGASLCAMKIVATDYTIILVLSSKFIISTRSGLTGDWLTGSCVVVGKATKGKSSYKTK